MAARDAAAHLWQRTDLRPRDVDTAQLYDGFSFLTLAWLEALGFCAKGESGAFVEDGRIALGGELPLFATTNEKRPAGASARRETKSFPLKERQMALWVNFLTF